MGIIRLSFAVETLFVFFVQSVSIMNCQCPIRNFFMKITRSNKATFARPYSSSSSEKGGDSKPTAEEPTKKPKRTLKKPNTPTGKFDDENVLEPFPNNVNPETGEVGGPRGPEPTRFGDWER